MEPHPLIEDKQEQRGSWTHLTFICDDSMVQTKLPQVIVGNEQLLRVQDMSCLKSQLPDNVYIVRQKSSWLNEPLFVQVLKWLLEALKKYRKTHHLVLLLDVATVHVSQNVWALARAEGLDLVYIPRKLTWLLQPCDTHLFRRYKSWLQWRLRVLATPRNTGQPTLLMTVRAMVESVLCVLQSNKWDRAFDANGWNCGQSIVSPRLTRAMKDAWRTVDVTPQWPGLSDLLAILPRRRSAYIASVMASTWSGTSVPSRRAMPKKPTRRWRVFPLRKTRPNHVGHWKAAESRSHRVDAMGKPVPVGFRLYGAAAKSSNKPLVPKVSTSDAWLARLRPRRTQLYGAAQNRIGSSDSDGPASSSTAECHLSMPVQRAQARRKRLQQRARPMAQARKAQRKHSQA